VHTHEACWRVPRIFENTEERLINNGISALFNSRYLVSFRDENIGAIDLDQGNTVDLDLLGSGLSVSASGASGLRLIAHSSIYQVQLPYQQASLKADNDYEPKSEKTRGIVRQPVPNAAWLVMLSGLLGGVLLGLGLGWLVTR
jgi:hypothetical protein